MLPTVYELRIQIVHSIQAVQMVSVVNNLASNGPDIARKGRRSVS